MEIRRLAHMRKLYFCHEGMAGMRPSRPFSGRALDPETCPPLTLSELRDRLIGSYFDLKPAGPLMGELIFDAAVGEPFAPGG